MTWTVPNGRSQLFVVALGDFVVWAGSGAIFPYLPVFLLEEAHASLAWIGIIASAYFAGVFAFAPLMGRISDRVGRKPLLVGGTALYGVATLLFVTTTSPWLFVGFRFIEGLSVAIITPAAQAFVAEITTPRDRSQAYGWLTSAQFGGLILGPALAWPLYALGGGGGAMAFYAIFIVGSLLSLVAAAGLAVLLREPAHAARARREQPATHPGHRRLLSRPVLALIVIVAAAEFVMGAWEVVWSIWLRSLGQSTQFIGITWIAFSAPILLSFAGGWLADRRSRLLLVTGGFAAQGLIWFVFALSADPVVLLSAAVASGLAFALAFPAKQALLVQVTPARWLASVQGVEQTSMQIMAFAGTLTAPLLYGALGGWIFAVCGGVALAGVLVATPTLRREWACLKQHEDAQSCRHLRELEGAAERAVA